MILYSLENLKKQYGDSCVLHIETMEIESGSIYALLGPNGSGKTTLLDILGFLAPPTSGKISFKQQPVVFRERSLQHLRRKVVMVSQNPILFTTTVYKNLEFGLKLRQIPRLIRRKTIEASLDLVGLRHMAQAQAATLSGGETQRIALARAIALSPEVILCDEPTASVDLENQLKINQVLKDINQEKKVTLIFTSHDKRQASSLPHHRFFLEQGKTSDFSNENRYSWEMIAKANDLSRAIQAHLPRSSKDPASGYIHIEPEAIELQRLSTTTASNQTDLCPGKVIRIREDKEAIRLIVECGVRLNIRISMDEYRQLKPMVGDILGICIPANAVSLQ